MLLPSTPTGARAPASLADPFRALRHRGLLDVALTALLYNFGFFTLLAFTPFPLAMGAAPDRLHLLRLGPAAGLHLGVRRAPPAAPLRHPAVRARPPSPASPPTLVVMAVFTDDKAVLAICVIVAGAFLGINNTLITETVMKAAPVERRRRLRGVQLRPLRRRRRRALAGRQARRGAEPARPVLGRRRRRRPRRVMLASGRRVLAHIDAEPGHGASASHDATEAEALTVGDA